MQVEYYMTDRNHRMKTKFDLIIKLMLLNITLQLFLSHD